MAATGSAPTARVIQVIELLARPGARWRYSEIARELNLTQATTHAILNTLTERGWVVRDPAAKTYTLGPGLVPVAAAVGTRPYAEAARAAATELAAEFGFPASVIEKLSDEALVITDFVGGERIWPGDRIPYAPPFGASYAAWDTDESRRAWLARSPHTSADTIERINHMLTRARTRGYDVDATTPALGQAASVLHTLDTGTIALPPNIRETLDQLRTEFTTLGFPETPTDPAPSIAAIAAPVLNAHGHAALLIALHPLTPLAPERIETLGNHIAHKAATIADRTQP
ncbi:DNA-binding IclR family transcriptional regulator [Nocardia transvalensis]|uniref:DNA-binding IclR family transcriptional regulator n=1 Tax=Nocardia transvalensis TaxID=37333 RepID=A0A7W9P9I1_9NOCA|nr:helix-turn-helix domain-containing protein [Nocardia transvalensis]MBB5911922.1 DNA-binding IclR family transcriptional regulator [Nocardia transvalensis]